MFARPRVRGLIAPPKKKRKVEPTVEEIHFDPSAREDYLNGFHKRKLQRTKQARESALKREQEEKREARKRLREGRKADLEKHVEEVNSLLRRQNGRAANSSEEEDLEESEQWEGIAEAPPIDHKDEYVDEDRFTTVTVEAVEVSRDGMNKAVDAEEENEMPDPEDKARGVSGNESSREQRRKRLWTKEKPGGRKKRKFHYESKAERKVTRFKERSGNKKQARARKGA